MSWYDPPKYNSGPIIDVNQEIKSIKGELDDKQSRITLAKFLFRNLGITTSLLTGIELYPDQIITIKGMMQSNFTLCVWGRGVSKTWTAAVYCILQCIFYPNTSILVAGPTFRTARFIFNHIEKICESPEAVMLAQAMGAKIRRNDEFQWKINGGEIVAIPLNGEKIRGFRADILLIDEFLLMPEELVEKVLIPYLVVPKDMRRRKRIRAREDKLIKQGVITEAQRTKFANNKKLIGLSSASYTCEYLYKKYEEYRKAILAPDLTDQNSRHFISQLSWEAVPLDRIDKGIIELAQSNEANLMTFKREYCAQFLDGSDSYFSMQKMLSCSVPDGEKPTLLLKGDKARKYILAIDPNASNSPTGDDFAMCLIELDEDDKLGGTVVHSYGESGKDLKNHIQYLYYLLTNFNVEMIIIDYAGYQFIEAANESELFRVAKINLQIFDFSAEKDGEELVEEIKKAKRTYNRTSGRIVFNQYFTSDFIRKGNEWLQSCFDFKRLWFGGSIKGHAPSFDKASSLTLDFASIMDVKQLDEKETPILYFIDRQEELIQQTRYQCSAIEVKTSTRGIQSFDLPLIMKRDNTTSRMRRDNYTAIMLCAWCMKCYYDIRNTPETNYETFDPMLV